MKVSKKLYILSYGIKYSMRDNFLTIYFRLVTIMLFQAFVGRLWIFIMIWRYR